LAESRILLLAEIGGAPPSRCYGPTVSNPPIRANVQAIADKLDDLNSAGWEAIHWSTVGNPRAEDEAIMAWARAQKHVVFTHDLDFGTLLALTRTGSPSVIQVRTQEVTPTAISLLCKRRQLNPRASLRPRSR
jgi:predicted nuclease of predicted toxin-antitoxin system